ncbi:MAG: hypothetical protein GY749_22760 [Desulfobacteraceae bacterium]|nr:hypothetical protein [Desulfobacteraceae bacterium]
MTDQSGSEQSGNPGDQSGGALNGSSDTNANPFSGLEGDNQSWIEAKGTKSVADLVTMARNSEKMTGGLHLPGKNAKPEDISSFLDKATKNFMPADANGYDFNMPDGMPENMPYDGEMADNMKAWMFDSGMPPQMADKFHSQIVTDFMIPAYEAELAEVQQSVDTSNALMKKEWGEPDSQGFKANMEYVLKAVNGFDGYKDALIQVGAIDEENNILNAALLMPLAKLGELHFSEDGMVTGDNNEPNPFANDSQNWTKANQIIASDPVKAKSLIIAAGKEPADYRL